MLTNANARVLPFVALAQIHDAPTNPNVMPAAEYATLVQNIRASGSCTQSILVRPMPTARVVELGLPSYPSPYEIIDGHHRAKASREAGLTHVPAVVVDADDMTARVLGLAHNRIRGELDSVAVGRLLAEIRDTLGPEMLNATGFGPAEIDALLASVAPSDSDLAHGLGDALGGEAPPPPPPAEFELTVVFASAKDRSRVKRAITKARGKGADRVDEARGLIRALGLDE